MIPEKTIEELITRHSSLEKDLASGNVDKKLFAEKSKEYSDLNEIIKEAKEYSEFEKNKSELEILISDENSDKEMKDLAETELEELKKNNQELVVLNLQNILLY